jgi:hypothetical protein
VTVACGRDRIYHPRPCRARVLHELAVRVESDWYSAHREEPEVTTGRHPGNVSKAECCHILPCRRSVPAPTTGRSPALGTEPLQLHAEMAPPAVLYEDSGSNSRPPRRIRIRISTHRAESHAWTSYRRDSVFHATICWLDPSRRREDRLRSRRASLGRLVGHFDHGARKTTDLLILWLRLFGSAFSARLVLVCYRRSAKKNAGFYRFTPANQFTTTVIGDGAASMAGGTLTRSRLPSGEIW